MEISFPNLDGDAEDGNATKTTSDGDMCHYEEMYHYGYGDGAPDSDRLVPAMEALSVANDKNNDKSTTDTTTTTTSKATNGTIASKEDIAKYDYGYDTETARVLPTPVNINMKHQYDRTRVPRRSSLKSSSADGMTRMQRRRASLGYSEPPVGDEVEVIPRGSRHPVRRRRSIEFQRTVQVREVTKVTTEVPSHDIWLQPEDFAKMKSDRRNLVEKHKMEHLSKLKQLQEEEDIRGLEKYFDKSGRSLKARAWDVVLIEQDEQEVNGQFDDQRLADLYRSTTYKSPEKAAMMGQKDAEAVQEYLMSPRTTKLMMRRLSC